MADKLKVKLWVRTNKNGSECEDKVPLSDYGYTDDEWRALSEEEQGKLMDEWALDFVGNNGEYGACVE